MPEPTTHMTDALAALSVALVAAENACEQVDIMLLQSLPFVDEADGQQDWLYSPRKYTPFQQRFSDYMHLVRKQLRDAQYVAEDVNGAFVTAADKRLRLCLVCLKNTPDEGMGMCQRCISLYR